VSEDVTVATDVEELTDPLYDLPPGQFVAARDAAARQARAAGDRDAAAAIAALRRPTVVAWLANLLARQRPQEMTRFLELGEALREATATLRGPALRELSRQRQQLVAAMVRDARRISADRGPRVTDDVSRGLEQTMLAALADPDAAEQLRAGRLSAGLEHHGFGGPSTGAGPSKQPAAESPGTGRRRSGGKPADLAAEDEQAARRREAARADLQRQVGEAWTAARRAAERRDEATTAAARARAASRDAQRRVRDLAAELEVARTGLEEAEDAERRARDERERAETEAEGTRRAVTELQTRLDGL
jgi:hypothetical protein